ncbi:hypothetical protein, conserved [Leishmania tarentolae]|uniref:RanBP2-type domain-containing protein n=1 Tax=Leishmania tarentolae TaxID=5689 RepID=A0A640KTF0_LEITA|nr:hypothetical protein, conserved [Leishmania tarentolae]
MKLRKAAASTLVELYWSPESSSGVRGAARKWRAARQDCRDPYVAFVWTRRNYASASSALFACREARPSYRCHRRPRAAAQSRQFSSPRVLPPHESLEEVLRTSTPLSLSTAVTSMATQLRRNHIIGSCPRLFAEEMCSFASAAFGAAACASTESHTGVSALLNELQNAAGSTTASASLAPTGEVSAETSLWRSYMHPFERFLHSTIHARLSASNSTTLPSTFLTDGNLDGTFLNCVCQLASLTDSDATRTVAQSMEALVQRCVLRRSSCRVSSLSQMELIVQRVLEASSPMLLCAVVRACQVRTRSMDSSMSDGGGEHGNTTVAINTSRAEEDLRGGCRWHPFMSDRAIKLCLKQIVQVLTDSASGRRKGKTSSTSLVTLAERLQIQRCCLCHIPRNMDDRTRHDCAVLAMISLKQAPFTVLLAAYQYFREEGLASAVVAQRFLAHCGVCVTHATQRGVSLTTYLSPAASKAAVGALLHAQGTFLSTGRDTKQMEATMSYVAATLNALGYPHIVRSFYTAPHLTTTGTTALHLCETPHSVLTQVLLRDVQGAVVALEALGASRPEGWLSVPPAVTEAMAAVSRLVGREGSVADVNRLYLALVGFHNAGLFISYYVECVLAGVCDRMHDIGRQQGHSRKIESKKPSVQPDDLLERIIPVFRGTLCYIGDELNADIIFEIVETALQLRDYAVPLTASLVSTLRGSMELSLGLQDLLGRVDTSTHNTPFLYYYALCYARDFGVRSTFEHLAALWRVDGDAIWNRATHLSPSCQLWKCATCGRLNSDRYNYCVCSALRYSHVFCGTCGYAQDERLRQCRSCGHRLLTKASLAGAVPRKTWQCRYCEARNPARQTLLCFRCGQPTGPCIRQDSAAPATESEVSAEPTSVACECCFSGECDKSQERSGASAAAPRAAAYAAAVGVCHKCGRFKMPHAAQHSFVWVCVGCHQRRSSLERICPSCPHVECLPQAVCREPANVPRVCRHCGHEEVNPLAVLCRGCGSTTDPFAHHLDSSAATCMTERVAVAGGQASHTSAQVVLNQRQQQVHHWCFHCHHVQPLNDTLPLHLQQCSECAASCDEKGLCLLPLRVCGGCGGSLPSRHAGSAVCPYCAAYVALVTQPQKGVRDSDSAQGYWTAVTLLHTCEVLEECCARESLHKERSTHAMSTALESVTPRTSACNSGVSPGFGATTVDARAREYLQTRPIIENTLSRLRREWLNIDAATWLSMRMDVAMLLGRAVNALYPWLSASLTARRLSALLKCILTHVDDVCGVAVTSSQDTFSRSARGHFTPVEVCHECLGTHPPDLCPFSWDNGLWTCRECGSSNSNSDVCRYVCGSCLALRPVTQELLVSTCWECHACDRANVQFERYCMHCGAEREAWSTAMLPQWSFSADGALTGDVNDDSEFPSPTAVGTGEIDTRSSPQHETNGLATGKQRGDAQEHCVGLLNLKGNDHSLTLSHYEALPCGTSNASLQNTRASSSAGTPAPVRSDEIPFSPTKCPLCGLVFIEARCPLCLNHIPDIADAKGTVCEVRSRCAFIQPSGTTRSQDRIFVDEGLLKANALKEGLAVNYTAELGQFGRMEARFLRC